MSALTVSKEDEKRVKGMGFLNNRGTDLFSARVLTINGKVTAAQHRCMAEAAEKFGNGNLLYTTRLSVEIQGIPYDKIEELESLLIAARAKKQAIEAEKLTGDNIYKVLIYFDQLYGKMNDREKRQLIEELISEIQIYPERQPNGQWLKSIKFRLPIIEEDMNISLDNEHHVESVVLLTRETES